MTRRNKLPQSTANLSYGDNRRVAHQTFSPSQCVFLMREASDPSRSLSTQKANYHEGSSVLGLMFYNQKKVKARTYFSNRGKDNVFGARFAPSKRKTVTVCGENLH